jgi:hypothetical protein
VSEAAGGHTGSGEDDGVSESDGHGVRAENDGAANVTQHADGYKGAVEVVEQVGLAGFRGKVVKGKFAYMGRVNDVAVGHGDGYWVGGDSDVAEWGAMLKEMAGGAGVGYDGRRGGTCRGASL